MAAVDAKNGPVKHAGFRQYFELRDTTTGQCKTGVAAYSATVSKDGAAFAGASDSSAHEIGATGVHYIDLTATEMTCDCLVLKVTATNATDRVFLIYPVSGLSSGVLASATSTSVTLPSTGVSGTDHYVGCVVSLLRGTGAGQSRTITDQATLTCTVDRAWVVTPDATTVYMIERDVASAVESDGKASANVAAIDGVTASADKAEKFFNKAAVFGTIDDAGPTAATFKGDSSLSSDNDEYNGCGLVLAGVERKIADYVGATRTFTFNADFPFTPTNGQELMIIGYFT